MNLIAVATSGRARAEAAWHRATRRTSLIGVPNQRVWKPSRRVQHSSQPAHHNPSCAQRKESVLLSQNCNKAAQEVWHLILIHFPHENLHRKPVHTIRHESRRVLTMGARLNPSLAWPSNIVDDLSAKSSRARAWRLSVFGASGLGGKKLLS